MPRALPPEIELILRAGAAAAGRDGAEKAGIEELAAAMAAVEGMELPPSIEKVRRAAEGLVLAAPMNRPNWVQMLSEALIELDDADAPDPALVAAWKRQCGEGADG